MTRNFPATILALISLALPLRAAIVVSVDVNDALDTPTDTASGFATYVLSDNSLTIGGYTVDINPASGAALDDVRRATPVNGGSLTLGAIYRDSIFAAGDNTTNFYRSGLDAVIAGLTPGKRYTITAWSFDSGSTGARTSDWHVLGLGGPQFAANNYTFDGATLPTTDTANRFSVTAYADTNGTLTLRGRPGQQSATNSVFLNGFTVDELAGAPMVATTLLAVDFNDRSATGAANTMSGFSEFLLAGAEGTTQTTTSRTFGAQTVTINAVGATIDDRLRTTPLNGGSFTESLIARDFIFASSTAAGLDVIVQGLTANTTYLLEVWSFDSGSATTVRTSDWTVNGAMLWDDYGFNGANLPTANTDYKMTGAFTANASGQLVISARSVANAPNVFINALRISSLTAPPVVDFGRPVISEFMAENSNGITDEDGDTSDWIEIWNTTTSTATLSGWTLSDDPLLPAKWTFPAGTTIPSQGFLRVWASAKNRTTNPGSLHTNFALDKDPGGYLALRRPDATVASEFANIPGQRANVSYGRFGNTEPQTIGYFSPSTPLLQNTIAPVPGFVADTVFSVKRGFFTTAQNVLITCATAGAVIYYTTDGSEPTTASAVVPGGGIPITTTTVLRAKAFAPPLAPSNTDTQTYIFNAHVQNQPAAPAGWPATWGTNSEVGTNNGGNTTVIADYEMDPNVVTTALPGYSVQDALAALPALSIVMNPSDFLGSAGIYQNPQSIGAAWEKACSFEYLETAGGGMKTNCGIAVHGNSSRRPFRMQKHSFRLSFRSEYGDGKLDYKLFDDTTLKQFNKLVLHATFPDGWGMASWDNARYRPETAVVFRDLFMKDTLADMGGQRISGRFVHLYINGLYWGVYELGERVDDNWCADHFGGLSVEWDVIAPDTTTPVQIKSGSLTAWTNLANLVLTPDLSIQANYDAVAAVVDLENFSDYYLLHIHADAEDWPHHNGYAYRNRVQAGSKWRFLEWDQAIAFDPLVLVDRFSVGAPNTAGNANAALTIGVLYQKLRASPEFRLLLADRARKHLFNGGALSLAVEQARWQTHANLLDKAIVAESARWGDTADTTRYFNGATTWTPTPANATLKRETHWLPQVNLVKNSHMPALHNLANSYATITELRSQSPKLYPATDAPDFGQFGGNVPNNYALTITAAAGQIYYTTNGTDPRTAYTGAPAGTLYTGAITLTATGVVKARALNGGEWSALTEATFIVGTAASAANLTLTELNYNPAPGDEEFIELMNVSAGTIDLTGVSFEGITYTFASGTLLNPGSRICIARDVTAFTTRYGAGPRVVGPYAGALDNTGEEIAVIAANGADIIRFSYNDKAPWPTAADGTGRSLVLRQPSAENNTTAFMSAGANWRSSTANGGNPGAGDSVTFSGAPLADADGDGLAAIFEYALLRSDASPSDGTMPAALVETLTIGGIPGQYLTLTIPVNPAGDSVVLTGEYSNDLTQAWQPATYIGEIVNGPQVSRKWRAPVPATGAQFLRLRATYVP